MIIREIRINRQATAGDDREIFAICHAFREGKDMIVVADLRGIEQLPLNLAISLIQQVRIYPARRPKQRHLALRNVSDSVFQDLVAASRQSETPFMYLKEGSLTTYWPRELGRQQHLFALVLLKERNVDQLCDLMERSRRVVGTDLARLLDIGFVRLAGKIRHQAGPGRPSLLYETIGKWVQTGA